MPQEENNIDKLKGVRDKLAQVFKDEVTDDLHDNGNLSNLYSAIITVEKVIEALEKRTTPPT